MGRHTDTVSAREYPANRLRLPAKGNLHRDTRKIIKVTFALFVCLSSCVLWQVRGQPIAFLHWLKDEGRLFFTSCVITENILCSISKPWINQSLANPIWTDSSTAVDKKWETQLNTFAMLSTARVDSFIKSVGTGCTLIMSPTVVYLKHSHQSFCINSVTFLVKMEGSLSQSFSFETENWLPLNHWG